MQGLELSVFTDVLIGVVIGVITGSVPVLLSQLISGRQVHAEARFQFYRDKANRIATYLATSREMIRVLVHLGGIIGAPGIGTPCLPSHKEDRQHSPNSSSRPYPLGHSGRETQDAKRPEVNEQAETKVRVGH